MCKGCATSIPGVSKSWQDKDPRELIWAVCPRSRGWGIISQEIPQPPVRGNASSGGSRTWGVELGPSTGQE